MTSPAFWMICTRLGRPPAATNPPTC